MADGHFPQLVSANRDANTDTNPIFVQLSDGAAPITLSFDGSNNLNVALANLEKLEDAAHVSGDAGIQVLAVRQDAAATLVDADGDYSPLSVTSTGDLRVTLDGESLNVMVANKVDDSPFAIATDEVGVIAGLADETAPDSVDEGDIGALRMTLDRKLLTRVVGANDTDRWDVDASGHGQVDIAAISVTALPISADSSANSISNPIFVQEVASEAVSSTEIHDFNTTASVAGDTTDNHDYTVTGSTFLLKSVCGSFSGGGKVEVQVGPLASLTTVAVAFIPKEGGKEQIIFDPPVEVPVTGTGTVRVIRTNRQGQAQDVYSTIMGNDLP